MSTSERWRRPASMLKLGLTALVACGLLTACSETPKISKGGEEQSRPVEAPTAGAPAPVQPTPRDFESTASKPAGSGARPQEPAAGGAAPPEPPVANAPAGPEGNPGGSNVSPVPPATEPPVADAPAEPAPAPEPPAAGSSPPAAAPEAQPQAPEAEPAPPPKPEEKSEAPADEDVAGGSGDHRYYKKSARPRDAEPETESKPGAGYSEDQGESKDAKDSPDLGGGIAARPSPPPAPVESPPPQQDAAEAPPPPPAPSAPAPAETVPDMAGAAPPAAAPPPPPPVAAAPPPVAPGAAARAAIEADPNKKFKVVPVFYGTDRLIEPDPTRLQFGAERGHKLQLGRALITVPLSHEVPNIERPRVYEIPYFKVKIWAEKEDPEKHFTLQEITSLTEEQMLALVKEQLAKSSKFKDHAFVFVHGFNTSFDCALFRTAQITYDLGFDGAPFLYSWPSGGKIASYTYDRASVEQAEPSLAEFLNMVIQKSGAKSISLIAHSMGNELLLRVLQRLRPTIPEGVVISQVILAAPDVDRDKFNIIAREITNFAKGVTLYAASNDRALGYSAQFWQGPRAGDIPKGEGPLIIPGVDTIDVTAVSTDALGLNHSGYAENPALLNDVKALVEYGVRPPNERLKSILAVESPAGTFWRFQATH